MNDLDEYQDWPTTTAVKGLIRVPRVPAPQGIHIRHNCPVFKHNR